ncbi:uncharacterized protein PGTG_22240 [Puccinia graminis f. sp. tritici CRL 75-36-700-3]|uniref:Uncharacterized protein n=1 Tax=Puccinia graminis f. sp. tritici (strain CRL 75-36-700-3 / race SCCL) TaxID=418459 RepID=H6QTW9_PUCGT|nr:uncharacterized protein PGTG_22240 [Puccinia graminis f. sp. tritici CRL 75-36-700-3]EHS64383.1 hypothetical protein PGTG_22240 [Puccinia graminis f. sp. tritici CRL 75-36-700-3]
MVPSGYWIALVHRNLPDLTARHLKECFHGGPCQTLDQCRGEGIAACFSTRAMWGLSKKHLKKILSRFCSQGVPNYRVKVFQI